MKHILLSLTLLFITCLTTARSQTPENMSMLTSPAELKLYALSNVTGGDSQVWGDAMISNTSSKTYIRISGDAETTVAGFMEPGNQFRFKVRDITKPMYVYSNLLDKNGNTLFSDYTTVTPVNGAGGLTIYPTVRLRMNPIIPVAVTGATYARINYQDENGNQWQQDVSVSNGVLYFPAEYAGKGTLIVGKKYPTNGASDYDLEIAYNLATGEAIETQTVFGQNAYTAIENHITYTDKFAPQVGILAMTTSMSAPSKDGWSVVSPPTGSIKLESTPEGVSRQFKLLISFPCSIADLGTLAAYTYDPSTVDAEGYVNEYPGTISKSQIQTVNGPQTTLTITWTVSRGPATTQWLWRIESSSFNTQRKVQPPYYGNAKD
jgi:hypothetical protein